MRKSVVLEAVTVDGVFDAETMHWQTCIKLGSVVLATAAQCQTNEVVFGYEAMGGPGRKRRLVKVSHLAPRRAS